MKEGMSALSSVIVVTSGKGGVGKTTACANIGIALALEGRTVCLVDTDIGLRNLDVVMGLESMVVDDIVDVVEGARTLRQALVKDPRVETLWLLPAAQTRDKNAVTPDQVRAVINELKNSMEYILVDCPAGIEQGFYNAVAAADRAIVVTNPEVSAVRDADRVIGLLATVNLPAPQLVVNRIRPGMVKRGDMLSASDIVDLLGIPLIGLVPDDEQIIRAGNLGVPAVLSGGRAGLAYRNIALRVLGQDVPFMDMRERGFLAKLAGLFAG